MKHKFLKLNVVLLFALSLLVYSCKEDNLDVPNDLANLPVLTTAFLFNRFMNILYGENY